MFNLIKTIITKSGMIYSLAKSDFKKRFVGSFFGLVWMFVQPLATVLVYTLIFQVGFRSTPPLANVPYVVWLICGLVPWFYFQDTLIQATNCLYEYNYLVKKVVFNVELLPIIKLVSVGFSHVAFLIILFVALFIAKIQFSFTFILVIYYSFALGIFALGISYFTSAINVFFKDMTQIVAILLQFGIWMCPIMYDERLFEGRAPFVLKALKFNPIYYIVKGYRNCLLGESFPAFAKLSIYYWVVTIIIFVLGYKLFDRLKEDFSDVL